MKSPRIPCYERSLPKFGDVYERLLRIWQLHRAEVYFSGVGNASARIARRRQRAKSGLRGSGGPADGVILKAEGGHFCGIEQVAAVHHQRAEHRIAHALPVEA